jgi:hypothetical protein
MSLKLQTKAFLLSLLACAFYSGTTSAQAAAGEYDLQVTNYASPVASAKLRQPVIFTVTNGGDSISSFYAGIMKNGAPLYEEKVNQGIARDSSLTIHFKDSVDMAYGDTTTFKVYVRMDKTDIDASNDTLEYTVNMPFTMDYPYTWNENSKNDFKGTIKWKYNASAEGFGVSGKRTNWIGGVLSKVITFPKDELVECNFSYKSSKDVIIHAFYDNGDTAVETATYTLPIVDDYTNSTFYFKATGNAQVLIRASMTNAAWNAYGSIYIKDICFTKAVQDLKTDKILSPMIDKVAVDTTSYKVRARFVNRTPIDVVNPKFCYNTNGSTVKEQYNGTVAAGDTLDYAFSTPYKIDSLCEKELTVWCEDEGDGKPANDTITKVISYYDALSFPYITKFDEDNETWSVVDNNQDSSTWEFGSTTDSDGNSNNIAYMDEGTKDYDDYLFTPAIKMPKGKSRVSFYYACTEGAATSNLQLFMGKTADINDMQEVIADKNISNTGWLNSYKLLDIPAEGNYYFAFKATGNSDNILIDNVYIDRDEDLCMNAVNFDTKSGFNKTTSKVTLSYINHGMTAQKDIKVRYYLNDSTTFAEETVPSSVAPGDTLYYTFSKAADISAKDSTYVLYGQIVTAVGPDKSNDMIYGQTLTHYSNKVIPYSNDFEDTDRNSEWTFTKASDTTDSKWDTYYTMTANSGYDALVHTGTTGNVKNNDWAISECIEMPKGDYELSFFYRTALNWDTPEYLQSFKVMLGTDATPEKMTMPIVSFDSITVGRPSYKKFICKLSIPEDGKYYIGFSDNSQTEKGETYIEDLSIKDIPAALTLPYASDFTNKSSEWEKYDTDSKFSQWTLEANNSDSIYVVDRDDNGSLYNEFEGKLVSPKLYIEPNMKVKISAEYAITSTIDTLTLNMFGGHIDNPDAMTLLAAMPKVSDFTTYTYEFASTAADSAYYIGLRSNTDYLSYQSGYVYKLMLKSVKVEYDGAATGVTSASSDAISINGCNGMLTIKASAGIQSVDVFDATGRQIINAKVNSSETTFDCRGLKGLYLVKVNSNGSSKVKKLIF